MTPKIDKMPKFNMIFARKNIFPDFFFGGGASASLPPISYAYGSRIMARSVRIKITNT